MFLVQLEKTLGRYSLLLGKISALLLILLLINVFYDVLMRYAFNDVSIGMQELEWHLYSAIFLLGIPFGLQTGGHVRVDLFYERLSIRNKAWIDLIGTLIFLMPFTLLVGWYGIDFAKEAYELGETSGDPGGLPARWIIKSVIPVAFFSMAVSGVGMILRCVNAIRGTSDKGFDEQSPQH